MSAANEPKAGVSKGLLAALGGVVVLALVGVFVIMPMMGGDVPVEPVVADAVPIAEPTPEPSIEPSEVLPPIGETFEVFSARDPFQQLVKEPESSTPVVGDPASNGGTPTEAPSDPVTGEPVKDAPPESTTEDGTTVIVEDVFVEDDVHYVLLTANGTAYTLGEGETFSVNWRVEAIDDPCVTLLYGDQARLVCEGESIRK